MGTYEQLADKVASGDATDEEKGQWNAIAWLSLSDDDLIRNSGSLGLPGNLHPEYWLDDAEQATKGQLRSARQTADSNARDLAGDAFVDEWLEENPRDE